MLSRWTQHLRTPDEKEKFQREILSAKNVLERLTEVLQEEIKTLELAELRPDSFENPNWANKQAFLLGMKAGLSIPIKMNNLDKQVQGAQIDR